jgi:hypothetical protein
MSDTTDAGAAGAAKKPSPTDRASVAFGVVALFALVIAFAMPSWFVKDPSAAWLWSLGGMTVFAIFVGMAINKRAAGLVIDNRNRVSLSKLQALAWTLMVLSALTTAVIFRIRLGFADPVGIAIPQELLAAMGLSAASLVAAPVVLSLKSNEDAAPGQAAATANKLDDDTGHAVGKVYARSGTDEASWLDLFRGDETGNAASPDLSKMQQFLITAVVLMVYGASIWNALTGPEYLTDESNAAAFFSTFPALSTSAVWLLGISHAGYLAYKAAPHSASASTPPPAKQDPTKSEQPQGGDTTQGH